VVDFGMPALLGHTGEATIAFFQENCMGGFFQPIFFAQSILCGRRFFAKGWSPYWNGLGLTL
jgi:hypothetical protein